MLEHEAFKGSTRIGTSDWAKEEPLLDAQDEGGCRPTGLASG